MSLFDSASIVVTPNAYKASKLYAIKPTDGSGDLTVVRATSATRVDSNGLIEIPRTNLLTYSEDFSNVSWAKPNITVTANNTIAPDGNLTADLITATATNGYLYPANTSIFSSAGGTSRAYSVFLKAGTATSVRLIIATASVSQNFSSTFNLSLGTATADTANTTVFIENYGNGWYRCTISATIASASYSELQLGRIANGLNFYAWGAQLEAGNSATEYIPTTSSIRTKFAGITQNGSSASNIPRIDYTNSTCPSILVEPQRTNVTQRSEDFSNGYWVKTNSDITSNTVIAPDGNLSADTFSDRVLTSQTYTIRRNQSYTSGTTYTSSFFAKNLDRRYVYMRFVSAVFGTNKYVFFDLQLGTIISVSSGVTAEIIDYGNGWFRCIATSTASVTTTSESGILIGLSDNGVNVAYINPSVKSIYIWGAQLQEGNVATEYIPTTSSIRTKFAGIIQDGSSASNIPRLDYTNSTCPSLLVEPQRTNLLLRSEEFDNASWTKLNISVTANSGVSPNGTTTADKIIPSATSSFKEIYNNSTLTSGIVYTQTYYAKADGYRYIQILSPSVNTGNMYANFDLQTATKTDGTSGYGSIQSVGNGWCKITATFTQLVTGIGRVSISIIPNSNSARVTAWTANGTDGILVWGAQLEAGSNATSYIPTTTASVTRNADVISKTGISSLIGQTEGTIFVDFNKTKNNLSILSIDDGTTNNRIFIEGTGTSTGLRVRFISSGTTTVDNTSNVLENGINKIAIIYANNNVSLYRNGVLIFNDNSVTIPATSILRLGSNVFNLFQLQDYINSAALWKTALTEQECINLTTI